MKKRRQWILYACIAVLAIAAPVLYMLLQTDKKEDGNRMKTEIVHPEGWFEIQVVDRDTGRGVPLVELETIDHRRFVTDNLGRIAIHEPDLIGRSVFFHWRSHGYEPPHREENDGPFIGHIELDLVSGGKTVIGIKRINIAERLYRTTGAGLYRDSVMLGYEVPVEKPLLNGESIGQDGGHGIVYDGKIYWGYGDTNRLSHPWGNFHATLTISDLPENGGLHPDIGINMEYITREDGFAKSMFSDWQGNVVWPAIVGVFEIDGEERLVMHYQHRNASTWAVMEHGLAVFNKETQKFDKLMEMDINEPWRIPNAWGVFRHEADGQEWVYFNPAFPNMRVPATIEALMDVSTYEAWSCLEDGSSKEPDQARLLRDENGKLVCRWTKNAPPLTPQDEAAYIREGLMTQEEAMFLPLSVEDNRPVIIHTGNVYWNEYRRKWIMLGVQEGGHPSYLGEMWYSEADEPTGPWKKAVKVASHNDYSFYNPSHPYFLNQENDRIIYFDGTYSRSFSGQAYGTPRYDYNLIRYRIDLSDPRIRQLGEADEE